MNTRAETDMVLLKSENLRLKLLVERDQADILTNDFKKVLGQCEMECHWHPTYGWVPEAGCPVHDP